MTVMVLVLSILVFGIGYPLLALHQPSPRQNRRDGGGGDGGGGWWGDLSGEAGCDGGDGGGGDGGCD